MELSQIFNHTFAFESICERSAETPAVLTISYKANLEIDGFSLRRSPRG